MEVRCSDVSSISGASSRVRMNRVSCLPGRTSSPETIAPGIPRADSALDTAQASVDSSVEQLRASITMLTGRGHR